VSQAPVSCHILTSSSTVFHQQSRFPSRDISPILSLLIQATNPVTNPALSRPVTFTLRGDLNLPRLNLLSQHNKKIFSGNQMCRLHGWKTSPAGKYPNKWTFVQLIPSERLILINAPAVPFYSYVLLCRWGGCFFQPCSTLQCCPVSPTFHFTRGDDDGSPRFAANTSWFAWQSQHGLGDLSHWRVFARSHDHLPLIVSASLHCLDAFA